MESKSDRGRFLGACVPLISDPNLFPSLLPSSSWGLVWLEWCVGSGCWVGVGCRCGLKLLLELVLLVLVVGSGLCWDTFACILSTTPPPEPRVPLRPLHTDGLFIASQAVALVDLTGIIKGGMVEYGYSHEATARR